MYKILVVDDDVLICDLYQLFFTKQGCEVMIANDGMDGLEKLKIITPDIILLDIMMPKMNGVDMLERLKSMDNYKHIPVFILSNLSDENIIEICIKKGAVQFLIKSQHMPQSIFQKVDEYLKTSTKAALT